MDVISLSQCMQRYHLGLAQALFFPAPPSLLELEYVRSRLYGAENCGGILPCRMYEPLIDCFLIVFLMNHEPP